MSAGHEDCGVRFLFSTDAVRRIGAHCRKNRGVPFLFHGAHRWNVPAFFVIFRGGIRTVPVICSMGRVFRRCHWFRGTRSRVCHWFRGTRSQNVIGFAEAHAVWPWSAECPHDFGNLFRGTLSSKRGRPATVVPLSSLSMRVRTRGPVVLTVVRRKGLICGSALGGPGGPKNRRSSMRRFDCGEEGPICCPCSEN